MTQLPSWPGVVDEILLDAPNDPAGAGVWSDVSKYPVSFSTKRGRQDETADVGPETMQWKLRNTDSTTNTSGFFDPFNPASTYYPNLKINRQGRKTLQWPAPVTYATDAFHRTTNAGSLTTADSGQAWTNLLADLGVQANTCECQNFGESIAVLTAGASDVVASITVATTLPQPWSVLGRCTDVNNFYMAQISSTGVTLWKRVAGTTTQLGSTFAHTWASGDVLGVQTQGTIISAALNGTTVISVTDSALTTGTKAGIRYAGGAFTATQITQFSVANVNVAYPLFRGYEDLGWPQIYESNGRYGYCTPEFVSALSILGDIDLLDCVLNEMLVDAPLALYPLSDGGGSQAGSISATQQANASFVTDPSSSYGVPAFGASSVIPSSSMTGMSTAYVAAAPLPAGSILSSPVSSMLPMISTGGSIEWWGRYTVTGSPSSITTLFSAGWVTAGGSAFIDVWLETTGKLTARIQSTSSQTVTTAASIVDGFPHHVFITVNAARTQATLYVDGVVVGTTAAVAAITATATTSQRLGTLTATTAATNTFAAFATYATVPSAARIAAHYQAGMTAFWGESAGNRIKRLLSYASWLPGLQSIDTTSNADSNTPLLGATDLAGTNVLAALQQVAKSVMGDLDVTADGKVRYRSRDYRLGQTTSAVTFGEFNGSGEIPYTEAPNIGQKRDQLVAGVIVNQRDGITIVRGNAQAALDLNGVKSYDVILANPAQVIDFADEMLRRYKDPHERVESVVLNPIGNPSMWPSLLGLDFGTRVRIMRRPTTTYTKQIDGYVESIAHNVQGGTSWTTTLTTSPLPPQQGFILDDATYGLLDSSASVLTF